jgi:myxalamid-type polyketide synthase MxaE and MxaD
VASVLGREDPQALDLGRGFFRMGMDSLMTVELRRRLEVALARSLPATIAFEYPTITAMTAFICEQVLDAAAPAAALAAIGAAPELASALDGQSAEEIASLLDDELGRILGTDGRNQ